MIGEKREGADGEMEGGMEGGSRKGEKDGKRQEGVRKEGKKRKPWNSLLCDF